MLKKILFTSLFVLAANMLTFAQCSPDESYTSPGVYPDSATNLPLDTAGIPYNVVVTVVIPTDTVVPIIGTVVIDSIGVTNIAGLPTNFTKPNNSVYQNGFWAGGTKGCILIQGMANDTQIGTYNLVVSVQAWSNGLILAEYTIDYYKIIVTHSVGVSDFDKVEFAVTQNTPNPFSEKTEINFTAPSSDVYNFTVYNLLGEVISNQTVKAKVGENKIEYNAHNIPAGVYMYKLGNKSNTITKRMIVSGN